MQPDPLIGRRLKQYEIQSLIGQGSMATVYHAFDHSLRRPVALKVLLPHIAQMPGILEQFQYEAQVLARLNHPNILQVYDVATDPSGWIYIAEQALSGPSLRQYLHTTLATGLPFSPAEVILIGQQVAGALHAAHQAGIVHRNVKPENIIRDADGRYVLTDFGLAYQLHATPILEQREVVGTPAYMSPEQAQGLPLTPATDVYALGIVLYELITGRVPFSHPTPDQVMHDQVHSAPPLPSVLRLGLPPAVDQVLLRALAKAPEQRYLTPPELVQALQQAWLPEPVPTYTPVVPAPEPAPAPVAAPASGGFPTWLAVVLGSIITIGAVAFAVWLLSDAPDGREEAALVPPISAPAPPVEEPPPPPAPP
ncbi:MAG: serine/threonine protein kinase, partial [Chloroflexaceae bacterium]|nr:serine/threonine protein kinase [Chloroflexaceae bacterium]